jgi:hypothetical protein
MKFNLLECGWERSSKWVAVCAFESENGVGDTKALFHISFYACKLFQFGAFFKNFK